MHRQGGGASHSASAHLTAELGAPGCYASLAAGANAEAFQVYLVEDQDR